MTWIHKSGIEWTDYAMNVYQGCPHGCKYCYAARSNRKEVEPRIQPNELYKLYEEAMKLKPGKVLLCSSTDPYPYNSDWIWLTSAVIKTLLRTHHHILVLTKGYHFQYDIPLFKEFKNHIEVGITLTTIQSKQAEV